MNDGRYFAKVVEIQDEYTIVVNAGENKEIGMGTKFLIVGIGKEIIDPETSESLGALEIIRGHAKVIHIQERMSTLQSIDLIKNPDIREITKVSKFTNPSTHNPIARLLGEQSSNQTTTETIKPQESTLKPLNNVQIGDKIILIK